VSKVIRGTERERPVWEYPAHGDRERQVCWMGVSTLDVLEMLESIRNTLEEIRDRLPALTRDSTDVEG
jgi:hypothetical protein